MKRLFDCHLFLSFCTSIVQLFHVQLRIYSPRQFYLNSCYCFTFQWYTVITQPPEGELALLYQWFLQCSSKIPQFLHYTTNSVCACLINQIQQFFPVTCSSETGSFCTKTGWQCEEYSVILMGRILTTCTELALTATIEIFKVQPYQPELKKPIYHEWFLPNTCTQDQTHQFSNISCQILFSYHACYHGCQ